MRQNSWNTWKKHLRNVIGFVSQHRFCVILHRVLLLLSFVDANVVVLQSSFLNKYTDRYRLTFFFSLSQFNGHAEFYSRDLSLVYFDRFYILFHSSWLRTEYVLLVLSFIYCPFFRFFFFLIPRNLKTKTNHAIDRYRCSLRPCAICRPANI